eukprot:XP_001690658.1 predicted protein [Chlamydomonas reinhardtii]
MDVITQAAYGISCLNRQSCRFAQRTVAPTSPQICNSHSLFFSWCPDAHTRT